MHKTYKTLAAIAYGGRIEKGSIVELPEEVAAAFGPEYVQPFSGAVPEDNADTTADKALDELSLAELKAKAKELGLSTSGSKADLAERIQLHVEADARANEETDTETDTEGDEPEEEETDTETE